LFSILLLGVAFAAPLTADEAVDLALGVHPDVVRAESELTAARGEARESVFLRSNPTVEGGVAVIGDRLEASIAQDVSLTGEGVAAHRAAVARRDTAELALQRARLVAAAEARHAWVDAVVARRREELATQALDLATRMLAATQAKVRVGEASELDLRLARMEQAKAARDRLGAGADKADALTELSVLVRRNVGSDDVDGDPLAGAPPSTAAPATERSDVLAARSAADAAKARLSSARAATLPAVTLGAFAEDDGELVAGPSLGITLPLWHQNQAAKGAASGELAEANAAATSTEARAVAEQETSSARQATADSVMGSLGADLDADATQALDSIERGFAAGELDLSETIFLRAEVVDGRTAFVESLGAQAGARIDALLAHDDPSLLRGAQ
jgi:outer membrane protein TolC